VVHVPVESGLARTGLIGLVLSVLEFLAGVLVDGGDVGGSDGVGEGIVFGFLAERVDVGALVARVEAASGQSLIGL